jgi:RNA polymerase sigma factor (sigma-70 family)
VVKRPRAAGTPHISWSDVRLVRECLAGSEDAWAALVDKYKRLIFSIPLKQGLSREDAADVFQRVCILMLAELPDLREPKALPMWLIRVATRESFRWQRQERVYAGGETWEEAAPLLEDSREVADQVLAQLKDEQVLRDALQSMPPRCQRLIEMLFFETPTRPYQEVARRLGLATGSIGFIRGRCLARLRRQLEKMGFR